MPHYHFELHIIIVKFGEQPLHMSKKVMDIYMSIIVELAYNMAKDYIQKGWRIERMDIRNIVFFDDISLTWND